MNEAPAIHLTKHALQRGEERLRLNASGLTRAARKAMREGMPMSETKGDLWHRMEAKMLLKGGQGNMTCIHQDVVFIIHDHRLITVYPLPKEFHATVAKWHARNPPSSIQNTASKNRPPAKSSGSLKDPRSGAMTPESPQPPLKSASKPLKSPVLAETRPASPEKRNGGRK